MKTTIYLDVDGVLTAETKRTPAYKISGWEYWETKTVQRWQILFSPDMVAALNELAAHPDITFKWLTTRQDSAAQVLSPAIRIKGEDWDVFRSDQQVWRGLDWWKLRAIQGDAEPSEGHRFVWIDDDISAEVEALKWAAGRDDVLTISPSSVRGLTRGDIERIRQFAGVHELVGASK